MKTAGKSRRTDQVLTHQRRRERRRRDLKDGRIVFVNGMCALDCTIRDRSENGARLVVAQTTGIPDTFNLYEKSNETLHSAVAVWRQSGAIGVKLTGVVDIQASNNPRFVRLRSL